jgi:hypothetical protein
METFLKFTIDLTNHEWYNNKITANYNIAIGVDVTEGSFDTRFKLKSESVCDIQQGDKLFFATGVTIPRVKLKNIYSEFGAKSVRDIEQATKVFIGHKTDSAMFDYSWSYSIKTEVFREYINSLVPDVNIDSYYLQKAKDALEFYQNELVLVDNYGSSRMLTEAPVGIRIEGSINSTQFYFVKPEHIEEYKTYQGVTLYNEDALLKYINGSDAVIIDEVMFKTLSDMFRSDDLDNHVLAMEIMANANYLESLVYLLLLFGDWGSRMYNQRSRNHVNFKSLCGFLGVTVGDVDQDDVCKVLIKKNAVTKENMEIVLKHYQDTLVDRYTHFKPHGITFSKEITKLLNEQLVIPLEEFTPEHQVEEVVTVTETEEEDVFKPTIVGFGSNPFL